MPHATSIIKKSGSEYLVSYGHKDAFPNRYESFKDAYYDACCRVGWDLLYITVDILPDEIRGIMDEVVKEHDKKTLENNVETTLKAYLEAKERLEQNKGE